MTRTDVTPELEAVARAIYESLVGISKEENHLLSPQPWDDLSEGTPDGMRKRCITAAYAALLAIREPTEDVQEALLKSSEKKWCTCSICLGYGFTAAIDHILGDKT